MPAATSTFTLKPYHELLLRGSMDLPIGLYQLHLATAEQLCRLHYSPGSIKAVKARLKELSDHGYLQVDSLPTKRFKSPYYYALSGQGLKYLSSLGLDVSEAYRTQRELSKSWLFLQHTLELNDVLIAAALLYKVSPDYYLEAFTHDRVLKRTLKGVVVPDAFLDFRAVGDGKHRRMPLLLEHDRGTEEQQHFRGKVRAYITLLNGNAYQALFGLRPTSPITIVFTTFVSSQRVQQMRAWTYQELQLTNEPPSVGLQFLFGLLTKPLDPRNVWFEPCWYTPYAGEPTSLLLM